MSQRFALDQLPAGMRQQAEAQMGKVRSVKPAKYRNEPIVIDGIRFDSKFEHKRWVELKNMERLGLISELQRQVSFGLDVPSTEGPVRIGSYVCDHTYRRDGALVLEEVKSPSTMREKLYVWKKNHVQRQYGVQITEVVRTARKPRAAA